MRVDLGTDAVNGRALADLLRERLQGSGQVGVATVSVGELHRTLIPYPTCREELGFATKAEYDLALLCLLEEAEVVEITETALADAVREELESPEPGLAFLEDFAASSLEIRFPPKSEDDGEGASAPPRPVDAPPPEERGNRIDATSGEWLAALEEPAEASAAMGPDPDGRAEEASADDARAAAATETAPRCRGCDGELPLREGVRYCPHCGADQQVVRCGRCGEPLETDWKYCPRCGGAANGSGEG